MLAPFASKKNLVRTFEVVGRYMMDRLRHARGTQLVMGNALAARLLYSLRQQKVDARFETLLVELVVQNGKVVGAVVGQKGSTKRLAQNMALCKQLSPPRQDRCCCPRRVTLGMV